MAAFSISLAEGIVVVYLLRLLHDGILPIDYFNLSEESEQVFE